jgi:hypothetical protein
MTVVNAMELSSRFKLPLIYQQRGPFCVLLLPTLNSKPKEGRMLVHFDRAQDAMTQTGRRPTPKSELIDGVQAAPHTLVTRPQTVLVEAVRNTALASKLERTSDLEQKPKSGEQGERWKL